MWGSVHAGEKQGGHHRERPAPLRALRKGSAALGLDVSGVKVTGGCRAYAPGTGRGKQGGVDLFSASTRNPPMRSLGARHSVCEVWAAASRPAHSAESPISSFSRSSCTVPNFGVEWTKRGMDGTPGIPDSSRPGIRAQMARTIFVGASARRSLGAVGTLDFPGKSPGC